MEMMRERGLYLKLAGALVLLLTIVIVALYGGAWQVGLQIAASNVALAHTDVDRALSGGAPVKDLTRFWRIGLTRGVVLITDRSGRVVSVPDELNERIGDVWKGVPDGYTDYPRGRGDFIVHVMMPLRKGLFVSLRVFTVLGLILAATLGCSAYSVARAVWRYVKERDRREQADSLKLAENIQTNAMPQTFPPFPDLREFDIFATMRPAKEVGGDFYDFYFTRPDRLLFIVADVSGKGVPAALFMMRAKSLLKGLAQTGIALSEAVSKTNEALCEGNLATVFVTAWIGELDLATGVVTYVNAGHNRPILRKAAGAEYVQDTPCLFLGALPGTRYVSHRLRLEPGDSLYLYTDGITEQVNEQMELFGEDRLLYVVRTTKLHQRELLERIAHAVRLHADKAEQTDDRTQLEIVWRGRSVRTARSYAPTEAGLAQAAADLEAALDGVSFDRKMLLLTAADEVFMNIIRHSGATTWSLRVERYVCPDEVRLVFTDDGKPFNPLDAKEPDTSSAIEDRPVGGLGIFIVKKTMSPVTYAHRNGLNVLTLGKVLEDGPSAQTAGSDPKSAKVSLAARIIRRKA